MTGYPSWNRQHYNYDVFYMRTHDSLKFIATRPWATWAVYMLVTALMYMLASRSPLFTPVVIQPWSIDEKVTFIPSFAYIYATYYVLLPTLILLARNRDGFDIVYATGLGCGLVNVVIYTIFPTMLPDRPDAPAHTLLSIIQAQDTTLCAFPSGHVALPVSLAAAAFLVKLQQDSGAKYFWGKLSFGYMIWAVSIAISTVFTGQHYIIDIYGGVLFGILVAYFIHLISEIYTRTFSALVTEWLVIIISIVTAVYVDSIPVYIIAGIVIATRQHALLMLFHDGVHALVADSRRTNDLVINLFVGIPLLIPVHVYRAIHISHHKHVGTARDPERLLLYWGQPWDYSPLGTGRLLLQLLGDASGYNSVVMMIRYSQLKYSDDSLVLPASRLFPELIVLFIAFICGLIISLYIWPEITVTLLLLWYLPYLTLTQLLQKLRSFAEHSLDEDDCFTYDWRPGLLGRLTIWPYNINYHRVHHAHTNIPWDRLPSYQDNYKPKPGKDFIAHLWSGAAKSS